MPWSISTESAFVTSPQLKVVEPPTVIVGVDAPKDEMLGAPLHPDGGGGAEVFVAAAGGGGAPGTVIFTLTV